jgi:phage-related holin
MSSLMLLLLSHRVRYLLYGVFWILVLVLLISMVIYFFDWITGPIQEWIMTLKPVPKPWFE